MLTLNDGRSELWQWDTGRTLAVDADCSQVHFSNKVFGRSIDVDAADGTAIIPDVLLQTDNDLNAWAFVGTAENGYTKISKTFKVNRRNKPADYVFTPTDQTSLEEIKEKIDYLESIQAPVRSVNGQTGEVKLTAGDVGAISQDDLQEATNAALAQAKASGEFDGADGADGKNGADGYSPTANVTQNNNGATITITDKNGTTTATVTNGKDGADGQPGADGKSAYQYAQDGGYTGTEAEFAAKLAAEKFTNPNALTFTGAVTGSYDGSAPLEVEIPSGGETGNGKDIDFTIEIQENTSRITFEVDDKNEPLNLTECFILIHYIAGGTNTANVNGEIIFNSLGPIVLNSLGVMPGQNYGRPWMLHVKKMFNTIFINAACMNTTGDITSTGVRGANFAYTYGLLFTESEKINKISIILYGTAAFAPGSKIRIIGR